MGQIVIAGTMGLALLLKAQARGKALLGARVVGAMSGLILVVALAVTHGVTGAAWGIAVAGGATSFALVAYSIGGRTRPPKVQDEGEAREAVPPLRIAE